MHTHTHIVKNHQWGHNSSAHECTKGHPEKEKN